ncbi:hypothetical protein EH223_20525 [candidate division KSB1 bacterium]|nr:family 10 glycosylhydrolase [candidate division KSB1 bacterium]RQV99889.1 MAG: hypothetical protein EH223_20525 [candidate division KSB1 bacterium]
MKRLCLFFSLLLFAQQTPLYGQQTRALWVTRWDYQSLQDIEKIMQFSDETGFNTILFQVRGNGTVTYQSDVELQSENFRSFGWDPLQKAIDSAHAHDLQLHAWVNLLPGWSGEDVPLHTEQLYLQRPDWFMVDIYGRPQELQRGYLFLSPTHPQVSRYLQELCAELYNKYDIDGIHFDYIRFPASSYSYDPTSVALFEKSYGAKPHERPMAWRLWRQNSISSFLETVYHDIKFAKPRVIVSAAVVSDIDRANDTYFQDSCGWLGRGLLDAVYPMLYSHIDQVFQQELEEYIMNSHGRHIYPGIHVTKDGLASKLNIVKNLDVPGVALFSYKDLLENADIKQQFVSAVDTLWAEPTRPAQMPWKIYTKDNLGPAFSQIQTIPSPLTAYTPFKIAAKITDPSGVYDDMTGADGQGIYVEYDTVWPPGQEGRVTLSKISGAQDWYISETELPGQAGGTILYARIYAHDDYYESLNNPKRNAGHSDVQHFPVLQSNSSYHYAGELGPILWRPGAIAVDTLHQIWVTTEKDGPVVVFDSTGKELAFSPIQTGMNGDYESLILTRVVGFARDVYDNMLIACNTNPPTIFRFSIKDGEALPGIHVNLKAGAPDTIRAFATDSLGNIYVLENRSARWFIFSPTAEEFIGMPYGDPQKVGSDIAVLSNGAMVFVTDRTSGVVQCWYGATEANYSQYWRAGDFLPHTIGLGDIYINGNDFLYICSSRYGFIAEYDRLGNLVGHITGENLTMVAPQAMAFSPAKNILYVTEVVGAGPGKVKVWKKQ